MRSTVVHRLGPVSLALLLLGAAEAKALNIGGYVIRQTNSVRTYALPGGTAVWPGGYIVIGRSASLSQFTNYWGVTFATNVTYLNAANSFPKIDGQERFSLVNSGGTNIDGASPATIDPVNKAVQRVNATYPATASSSWHVVSWSAATPGSGCAGAGTNGIVISEFSDAGSFQYEFVELFYDGSGIASNIPPLLQAIENKTVTISNTLQFSVEATMTDGDDYTLAASNLPSGATFPVVTNSAGTFAWTTPAPLGVYTTTFYAIDHDGADSQTITISVLPRPTVQFQLPDLTAGEDVGTQAVQVVISRAADATVEVACAGTATWGTNQDYTLVSTAVVFSASGPTQTAVQVRIYNDDQSEGMETVLLSLTNASAATIGSGSALALYIRDNDAITIMSANLVSGSPQVYREEAYRIFQGLKPDIVAMQEWLVTNSSIRAFVDRNFGTNFYYYIEPQATNYFPMPNGIVSRWPITGSGEWADTEVVNRDFAWASIDIPGDRDLHVISVHLASSAGPTTRVNQARALTNYIATAGWPANDYVVLAGDLNTENRSEPCLAVLTNLLSDGHKPADQNGDQDSNSTRTKPFDYVLPKNALNSNHAAVVIGGISFPEGLVFDSTLWTNPPSPIQTNDSHVYNLDHMAVMKAFSIGQTPPALQPINEQHVAVGNTVLFSVSATPTDGDAVSLTASNLPAGAVFGSTNENGAFTWTNASPVGTYTSRFYATDNDGTEMQSAVIHVLVDGAVWINEIHYDNTGTDTNEGVEIAGAAGVDLSYYTVFAYNGADGSAISSNRLSGTVDDEGCGYGAVWVPYAGLENGPDAVALVRFETNVVQFLSYEGVVVAVDGPAVELSSTDLGVSEAGTEPVNRSLQLTGAGTNYAQFSWAGPSNTASRGSLNALQTIYPCAGASNQPPVLYTIGDQAVLAGNSLFVGVSAWDVDGDPIALTASNLPAGAEFGSTNASGLLTWTNAAPVGVYTTSLYATDNDGTDSETLLIAVNSGTEPPVWQNIPDQAVIEAHALAFNVAATDAESDPITLIVSNAPAGSTFVSTNGNGTFTWTNAAPVGVYTAKFYAVDDDGSDYDPVKITVTARTNLPVLAAIDTQWVGESNTLAFTVTATDADDDAITLTVSNAPAGSTFEAAGGNGLFTWTNAAPVGVYTALLYAADNDGTVSTPAILRVVVNGQVWINEVHYDNAGTDTNEGVEIAGTAGTDLGAYTLYAYNGADGEYYSVSNLSGTIDDEGCGYGAVWFGYPANGLQQGPDGVALVQGGSNLVYFLTYEATFTASNGPAAGTVSTYIKVSEAGTETNRSLQLTGVGTSYWQFAWGGPTSAASRGDLNANQTIYPCGPSTNQAPLLNAIGSQFVGWTQLLTIAVSAWDYNGDPITLTVSNAPAGSTFEAAGGSGTFAWTNAGPIGVYTTSFYAADDDGADCETVLITVQSTATNPPVIAGVADKLVTLSNSLQFAVTSTELDGDPVTLSVSNAPPGSEFPSTNTTGTFIWTNASPVGVYTATFWAVDKDGFDTELVVITVQAPAPPATNSLALYDFEDGSGVYTNTPEATHSNIAGSAYVSSDGTNTDVTGNPGRAISDTGWTAADRYYTFTISVENGYQADITGLQFHGYRSSTGPTNWILRYSGDGYSTDLGAGAQLTASLWLTNSASLSLTGLTGAITFRLYGTNAGSSAGTWRQDNVQLLGSVSVAANNDLDGDGIPNDWEIRFFGGATNATPTADDDWDLADNWSEFVADTSPTNGGSVFCVVAIRSNATGVVQFGTTNTRVYGLYFKTNLLFGDWMSVETNLAGNNAVLSIAVTNQPMPSYFRPKVALP